MKQLGKPILSPIIVSAVLLFGIAFNINLPDMGETYVSRNLFAWAVIFLLIVHLWWQPLRDGRIRWSPFWLITLLTPFIGFVFILAVNILGGFEHYHTGHYLFPLMLLAFALLIGGLLQYQWDEKTKFYAVLAALISFMPQFLIHLATGNELVSPLLPAGELALSGWLYKPFAGFGQYNLFGSAIVTLLLMACSVFIFAPVSTKARIALMLPVSLLAIDLPFSNSSTALLGLFLGLGFLAAHILIAARQSLYIRRYLIFIGIIAAISLAVVLIAAANGQTDAMDELSAKRASYSFNTRLTMWIVGFWGFVEQPVFGNGLGSYLSVYMSQFGQYGLAQGLTFFPNVTIPHNMTIHILAETGLFGFAVLLGPFIYIAVKVLQKVDNRLLVLALLAPTLVHTQLEYPYIASGTHYWLFAIAFVFALGGQLMPERNYEVPSVNMKGWGRVKLSHLGLGALSLSAAIGIYTAISLALMASFATQIFARSHIVPLDQYMSSRFAMPDVQHPILGKRLSAIAHIALVQKAIKERRADILREISMPMFEQEIVPNYPTARVWEIMLSIYTVLGEGEKAMQLIDYVRLYTPEKADEYEAFIRANILADK